jgi:hypothetical protein
MASAAKAGRNRSSPRAASGCKAPRPAAPRPAPGTLAAVTPGIYVAGPRSPAVTPPPRVRRLLAKGPGPTLTLRPPGLEVAHYTHDDPQSASAIDTGSGPAVGPTHDGGRPAGLLRRPSHAPTSLIPPHQTAHGHADTTTLCERARFATMTPQTSLPRIAKDRKLATPPSPQAIQWGWTP